MRMIWNSYFNRLIPLLRLQWKILGRRSIDESSPSRIRSTITRLVLAGRDAGLEPELQAPRYLSPDGEYAQSKVPLLTAREPDTRYEISDSLDFLHLFISEVRSQAYAPIESQNEKGRLDGRPMCGYVNVWPRATRPRLPETSKNLLDRAYLPEAAPTACGYISAIFSSRAFMLLPVSRVASTAG